MAETTSTTPIGTALSAKYKSSFAYVTIKDRLPVILSKIADTLYRNKEKIRAQYGDEGGEELKPLIGKISKLRNEVQTNKPILSLTDSDPDVIDWNNYLREETERSNGQNPTWFNNPWLYVECYMYRRIQEAVNLTQTLNQVDVFQEQKEETFLSSHLAVKMLLIFLDDYISDKKTITDKKTISDNVSVKSALSKFLRFSLWGNKCDLSISAGFENSQKQSPIKSVEKLESNILIDDTENIWILLNQLKKEKKCPLKIEIILDNAGYEILTDFCLAEFLLVSGLARCVHFHGKNFPWFVSDVTPRDFKWTLDTLAASSNSICAYFGKKWKQHIADHSWKFSTHKFWTLPHDFNEMKNKFPDLFDQLATSDFLIFKGDLNYRKLVGDINWEMTTLFSKSIRDFHPTPLCALRTIKSDTVVGLEAGVAEQVAKEDPKWLVSGNWGLICLSQNVS